jgi:hypothetical protein
MCVYGSGALTNSEPLLDCEDQESAGAFRFPQALSAILILPRGLPAAREIEHSFREPRAKLFAPCKV